MAKSRVRKKKKNGSSPFTYFLIAILVFALGYSLLQEYGSKQDVEQVGISSIQSDYNNPDSGITSISVEGNTIKATYKDGSVKQANKEAGATTVDLGLTTNSAIPVDVISDEDTRFWLDIVFSVLPFLLLIFVAWFFIKNIAGQNKNAMGFGQSKARSITREKTTFADVAGAKEAKQELEEIADFLKNPKKFTSMGAKIPKGVMLVGSPGTGKTLLARAVAGEANVPFFSLSGSEFVEMFVGVGASRVRDLFKKAKQNAPCIIFIDELDAVGRQRGAGVGGGHDEREQTLNQILTEMDGFEKGDNVIVLAATNRPDVLDPALLRPGRFDRHVTLDKPDMDEREEILEVHIKGKPLAKDADLRKIASKTAGFSGAELANLLNEAAIITARHNEKKISQKFLDEAHEKILMGPERKGKSINEKEKQIIAYHEAGHAVVGHYLPHCDPVHKISIISRGMALGVTWFLPKEDERLRSKNRFLDELASLMGGRVAEEVFFGDVTTGASNDLERATKMAREMVTKYGMSSLGHSTFGEQKGSVFLGRDLGHEKNYSEETAKLIDDEVKNIVESSYKVATDIIKKRKTVMDKLAKELLKKETLSSDEFEAMMPK